MEQANLFEHAGTTQRPRSHRGHPARLDLAAEVERWSGVATAGQFTPEPGTARS